LELNDAGGARKIGPGSPMYQVGREFRLVAKFTYTPTVYVKSKPEYQQIKFMFGVARIENVLQVTIRINFSLQFSKFWFIIVRVVAYCVVRKSKTKGKFKQCF